jgi:hypothetical protein
MEVVFLKPESGRRYRSRLTRPGGLVVELEGGSWNRIGGAERELPHDLAHLVVEDGLGLTEGLWGVIAAGAVFGQVEVVAGRRPPHHDERGRALFAAAKRTVGEAEMLVRTVCDVAVAGETRGVGEDVARTVDRLREAARAWAATPPGAQLRWEAPNLSPAARRRR